MPCKQRALLTCPYWMCLLLDVLSTVARVHAWFQMSALGLEQTTLPEKPTSNGEQLCIGKCAAESGARRPSCPCCTPMQAVHA